MFFININEIAKGCFLQPRRTAFLFFMLCHDKKGAVIMRTKGRLKLFGILVLLGVIGYIVAFGIGDGRRLSAYSIEQGLDLSGGVDILYEADKGDVTQEEMAAAISLLQGRMDWNGWTEAEVQKEGDNRIRVQIPGVADAQSAIDSIGKTAQLNFVDGNGMILFTGEVVANATKEVGAVSAGGAAQPYVALEFTPEGKELFAQATRDNLGKIIYIIMDEEILCSPTVQSVIAEGQATITGGFTQDEAANLAALIRAGSLPFDLNVIQMKHVEARLGAEALDGSIKAGVVGLGLILLFMLVVYRVLGLAANLALLIYVGLDLMILSALHITMTLPGIAGLILSIGMAVDANVVIYERIKEELIAGKTLRVAIKKGFARALPAIVDGNVTTLIAAVVLYLMGSGGIKGFASTLFIGVVLSMFTALVVTKFIVQGLMEAGIHNPKYYGMRRK